MRIVRGTRRGGSLDMSLAIAMGIAVVVPLAGNMVVPPALDRTPVVVPLTLAGTLVVPLAAALIDRAPVPGR
ncbi:hypothetical protein AB0N16_35155 [Streptomyces sp. NPDC051105]|uniref:hypothetical protein n=1 Tax=Streptomyces sp. NPDC051105 TaxID=3154843 RepID=UPI003440283F